MANQTGYAVAAEQPESVTSVPDVDHAKRKREFLTYLSVKDAEIREQQNSRRYYHGVQYTADQVKALNKRKQPVVTYNRVGRKINAVVGLLERQKQDPRGYPRTPKHEEGAEIATAVLRYVCDEQDWSAKSLVSGLNGSVDGLGGIELILEQGDQGDVEVGFDEVDPSSYFYDPRSIKADFSDARFMGVGKWADVDATVALFPDKEAEIRASVDTGSELTSNPDSDKNQWYSSSESRGNRLRLIDHWYLVGNEWFWCIYTGSSVLASGPSYLKDEKGRSICKYVMYSANIDQDGDRYGFVRNMKSSQDEINQRRSKGLHTLNSRRIFIERGSGMDVEHVRKEMARPDGVVEYVGQPPTPDDGAKGQELQGHLAFLEDAKNEIENYGFNPALIGQGVDNLSGRAMQLQQQAGIAELGPYLTSFKNWKLRVYRAIWCAVQEHWTGERWLRVTDDDNVEWLGINQMGMDPHTGLPTLINSLGTLDVDIIIDEGPDTINMQQDAYDTLSIMAQKGQQVPPQLLLELSPLAGSVKKKAMDILEKAQQQAAQPDPIAQAGAAAEIAEKNASAKLKEAQAIKAMADAQAASQPQPGAPGPTMLDAEETMAKIRNTDANTAKTIAETSKTRVETALKPAEMAHQQREADLSRQERFAIHKDNLSKGSQQ